MLSTSDPIGSEASVTVLANGTLRFVWDDELESLLELGHASVRRASHVEPAVVSPAGGLGCAGPVWLADMSPVGGPTLGPFRLRYEALAAEREWLSEHGY